MRIVVIHVFAYLAYSFGERKSVPRYAEIALVPTYYLCVGNSAHRVQVGQRGGFVGVEFGTIEVYVT